MADIHKFEEALRSLEKIESLTYFYVGKPADTHRAVVDRTYTYALITAFHDIEGHDLYQQHKLHLDFLESCKHLWEKVVIYDTE